MKRYDCRFGSHVAKNMVVMRSSQGAYLLAALHLICGGCGRNPQDACWVEITLGYVTSATLSTTDGLALSKVDIEVKWTSDNREYGPENTSTDEAGSFAVGWLTAGIISGFQCTESELAATLSSDALVEEVREVKIKFDDEHGNAIRCTVDVTPGMIVDFHPWDYNQLDLGSIIMSDAICNTQRLAVKADGLIGNVSGVR